MNGEAKSETAQVDIGPNEIVKSNSCSNGSYMNDVSLSDLPIGHLHVLCIFPFPVRVQGF